VTPDSMAAFIAVKRVSISILLISDHEETTKNGARRTIMQFDFDRMADRFRRVPRKSAKLAGGIDQWTDVWG